MLVASLFLSGCEQATSSVESGGSGETVTILPRIVRTALVPDHLFLGTSEVRIQAVSSNTSFHFDKTVPFSDRSITIDKVPSAAQVVISLEGYDPSGNLLWSGASASFLASTSTTSGVAIPLDAVPGIMPYQSPNSWLWSDVRNADTTVEWLNLNNDGTYSRQLLTWNFPSGAAARDTFYGIYEAGSYLRKGATLELEPLHRDSCAWRGTNGNECGLSGPNWVESYPARYVASWGHSASAPFPLTFEGYSYADAGKKVPAKQPFVLAPSTWSIDSLGSLFSVDYAARYLIQLDASGTYELLAAYTTIEGGVVFTSAYQTGTWTGNARVLNIVPSAESFCELDENITTCDNPANLRPLPTDSIGKPSALTWRVQGDVLTVYDPSDSTTQIWKREF